MDVVRYSSPLGRENTATGKLDCGATREVGGDPVVITGMPPGVGVFRTPSIVVRDGDEISVDIEGIGTLANCCVEEMV